MKLKKYLSIMKKMGPGIITGAADNDPSGIATYSQAGAAFGLQQLWTAFFLLPLQVAVQEACARIGAVKGKGIASAIKNQYGKPVLYILVLLVFVANTINVGADIGAMAASLNLFFSAPFPILVLLLGSIIAALEIFICYKNYARFLKWLCLSLLAYPLTVFMTHVKVITLLKASFWPHLEFSWPFLFILTGLIGTTISPYLFFWEASQVVEEEKLKRLLKKNADPLVSQKYLKALRLDNFLGMVFSQVGAWAIIVVCGVVLHGKGITDIQTAADAAKALEPLMGRWAELIFVMGIVGLGLLSVPVLAGSAAYALSETFNWRGSLNYKFKTAQHFYGVIIISTGLGILMNFLKINPLQALMYSAVVNGIVAIPLIFFIGLIVNNRQTMGEYRSQFWSNVFLWAAFGASLLAALGMFSAWA